MAVSQLKKLSLEDLATVEVTSVSRRSEQLADAAASVEVVTAARIERAGARSLPDALRLATGLDVAQSDGHTWAISSRGFANTTANKMEVLFDGRSLYSPLFSGVFWDVQDTLLTDLDRIEVIRGPGAVQWGANAVNGVINIISKPAAETQGGLVTAVVDATGQGGAAVRHGGRAAANADYRLYAKTSSHDALRFSDGSNSQDRRRLDQLGGRLDFSPQPGGMLTIQGDAYQGSVGQFNSSAVKLSGANLLSRWTMLAGVGDKITLQGYYDRTHRDIPATFAEDSHTFDFQAQREYRFVSQTVVAGAHARISMDRIRNSVPVQFLPNRNTTRLFSGFAQDEIRLPDKRWRVIVGSTLEHNSFTGVEAQPTARLAFAPTEQMSFWAAVSRAVRTPSLIDRQFFSALPNGQFTIIGNPNFTSENLQAIEGGWRWRAGNVFFADISVFRNRYDNLRSQEPVGSTPFPFTLRNGLNARTSGLEVTLTHQPTDWFRWTFGWRDLSKSLFFDAGSRDATGGASEGNDPRHLATLQTSFDLPRGWSIDTVWRYTSRRPAPVVPAYWEADVRIARRISQAWEFALAGRNLFDSAHREFGAALPTAREVPREASLSITWQH